MKRKTKISKIVKTNTQIQNQFDKLIKSNYALSLLPFGDILWLKLIIETNFQQQAILGETKFSKTKSKIVFLQFHDVYFS